MTTEQWDDVLQSIRGQSCEQDELLAKYCVELLSQQNYKNGCISLEYVVAYYIVAALYNRPEDLVMVIYLGLKLINGALYQQNALLNMLDTICIQLSEKYKTLQQNFGEVPLDLSMFYATSCIVFLISRGTGHARLFDNIKQLISLLNQGYLKISKNDMNYCIELLLTAISYRRLSEYQVANCLESIRFQQFSSQLIVQFRLAYWRKLFFACIGQDNKQYNKLEYILRTMQSFQLTQEQDVEVKVCDCFMRLLQGAQQQYDQLSALMNVEPHAVVVFLNLVNSNYTVIINSRDIQAHMDTIFNRLDSSAVALVIEYLVNISHLEIDLCGAIDRQKLAMALHIGDRVQNFQQVRQLLDAGIPAQSLATDRANMVDEYLIRLQPQGAADHRQCANQYAYACRAFRLFEQSRCANDQLTESGHYLDPEQTINLGVYLLATGQEHQFDCLVFTHLITHLDRLQGEDHNGIVTQYLQTYWRENEATPRLILQIAQMSDHDYFSKQVEHFLTTLVYTTVLNKTTVDALGQYYDKHVRAREMEQLTDFQKLLRVVLGMRDSRISESEYKLKYRMLSFGGANDVDVKE